MTTTEYDQYFAEFITELKTEYNFDFYKHTDALRDLYDTGEYIETNEISTCSN
jgi:hypothetical protein